MKITKNKNFMKLYLASVVSRFGDSIDVIAYSYLAYQLTGSKMILATVFIMNILPNMIFGTFAGTIVGFYSKKKICIVGDMLRAVLVGITAAMYFLGILKVSYVFIITFLMSTVESFVAPCKAATIPRIVDEDDYLTISSSLQSVTSLVVLLGTAVAGGLIGLIGIHGAMAVDAVTFLISGIFISFVAFPKEEEKVLNKKNYWKDYGEGFKYLIKNKFMLVLLFSMALLNFLLTPIGALEVAYVDDILKSGPEAISYIGVALSIGAIIGGFLAKEIGKRISMKTMLFIGLVFVGVFFIGMVAPYWIRDLNPIILACGAYGLIGVSVSLAQAAIGTIAMQSIDDDMRGRFSSIASIVVQCASPLGAFASGVLATFMGIHYLYICFGVIFILFSIVPTIVYGRYENSLKSMEVVKEA